MHFQLEFTAAGAVTVASARIVAEARRGRGSEAVRRSALSEVVQRFAGFQAPVHPVNSLSILRKILRGV